MTFEQAAEMRGSMVDVDYAALGMALLLICQSQAGQDDPEGAAALGNRFQRHFVNYVLRGRVGRALREDGLNSLIAAVSEEVGIGAADA